MNQLRNQTAIEWLLNEMERKFSFNLIISNNLDDNDKTDYYKTIKQAKAMEREQIERAYMAGDGDAYNLEHITDAEDYYNEVYKGGEQ